MLDLAKTKEAKCSTIATWTFSDTYWVLTLSDMRPTSSTHLGFTWAVPAKKRWVQEHCHVANEQNEWRQCLVFWSIKPPEAWFLLFTWGQSTQIPPTEHGPPETAEAFILNTHKAKQILCVSTRRERHTLQLFYNEWNMFVCTLVITFLFAFTYRSWMFFFFLKYLFTNTFIFSCGRLQSPCVQFAAFVSQKHNLCIHNLTVL